MVSYLSQDTHLILMGKENMEKGKILRMLCDMEIKPVLPQAENSGPVMFELQGPV